MLRVKALPGTRSLAKGSKKQNKTEQAQDTTLLPNPSPLRPCTSFLWGCFQLPRAWPLPSLPLTLCNSCTHARDKWHLSSGPLDLLQTWSPFSSIAPRSLDLAICPIARFTRRNLGGPASGFHLQNVVCQGWTEDPGLGNHSVLGKELGLWPWCICNSLESKVNTHGESPQGHSLALLKFLFCSWCNVFNSWSR